MHVVRTNYLKPRDSKPTARSSSTRSTNFSTEQATKRNRRIRTDAGDGRRVAH